MTLEVGGWSGKVPNKRPRERIGVWNVSRGQEDKGQRAYAEGSLQKSTEERQGWCVLGFGGGSAEGNEVGKAGGASLSVTL